jgi:CheY-like chemotaxis protein
MPHSDVDGDRHEMLRHGMAGRLPQQDVVLVVGRSPVNLIVLSKIVERARMRAVTETPERAGRLIEQGQAAIVILDGGADMTECDGVMGAILDQKLASSSDRPFVIMLTMRNMDPATFLAGGAVDALVAKPVTPERLQPLIESVRDRNAQG